MDHQPHPTRDHDHQHHQRSGSYDQHRILDLDAEVFGDNLAAVLDLTGVPLRAASLTSAPAPAQVAGCCASGTPTPR